MLEIIDIIKNKYNINNINHIYLNDNLELIEFNINAYASVKIFKIKEDDYILLISITNSNLYPTKNVTINIRYNLYEKLKYDLKCFEFFY